MQEQHVNSRTSLPAAGTDCACTFEFRDTLWIDGPIFLVLQRFP